MVTMRFNFSLASPDLLLVIILCLSDLDLSLLIGLDSRQLGELIRFHYFRFLSQIVGFTKGPDNKKKCLFCSSVYLVTAK